MIGLRGLIVRFEREIVMSVTRRSTAPSGGPWYTALYDERGLKAIATTIGGVLQPGCRVVVTSFDSALSDGLRPSYSRISGLVHVGREAGVGSPVLLIPVGLWVSIPSERVGEDEYGSPCVDINGDHVTCVIPYLFGGSLARRYYAITRLGG